MLSSNPGLYPKTLAPKHLQTMPNIPWGAKSPPVEKHCLIVTGHILSDTTHIKKLNFPFVFQTAFLTRNLGFKDPYASNPTAMFCS